MMNFYKYYFVNDLANLWSTIDNVTVSIGTCATVLFKLLYLTRDKVQKMINSLDTDIQSVNAHVEDDTKS